MYIVTGGGRGIGRSLARALAARGHPVMVIGRHESTLKETAGASPNIQYRCVDVTLETDRRRLLNELGSVSRIQGLIHNAGIIDPIIPVMELTESGWHQCLATNVDAPLFLTQLLKEKLQHGRVLHIGSGAAYFPIAGWTAYCVSKAALSMLTRCFQAESVSISFASVMPGIVDTMMQQKIREATHMPATKRDFFKRLKKEHELLSPETVALFLCWLLLDIDEATFVSQEWDIYETSHHSNWLVPPHVVPEIRET